MITVEEACIIATAVTRRLGWPRVREIRDLGSGYLIAAASADGTPFPPLFFVEKTLGVMSAFSPAGRRREIKLAPRPPIPERFRCPDAPEPKDSTAERSAK